MTPRRRPDDGSALIIALVFVLVMGLVITALLVQTNTSFKTTQVVRSNADKVYAADAGLEEAVQMLRADRTICPTPGSSSTFRSIMSNGHTVELACSNQGSGSSSGAEGWAVIITGTASDSFQTEGGGNKSIDGPVFARNLGNPDRPITVNNGSVFEQRSGSSCNTDADKPAAITIAPTPPFQFRCTTAGTPDPAHELPTKLPTPTNPAVTNIGSGSSACRIFSPGRYTALSLANNNYFRSGTYYFDNVVISIDQTVVGGRRANGESSIVVNSSECLNAQSTDPGAGTGIKWILGGSSRIDVANSGRLELFARQGGTGSEGQMGISVQAVTSPAAGPFTPSSVPISTSLITVGNGSNPNLVVHGMVYAPTGFLDTFATNESQANFQGGVVIRRLRLQSSASASGLVVAVSNAPGSRDMVVTATAIGQGGSKNITATAVLELDNTNERTFKVVSWRTG